MGRRLRDSRRESISNSNIGLIISLKPSIWQPSRFIADHRVRVTLAYADLFTHSWLSNIHIAPHVGLPGVRERLYRR